MKKIDINNKVNMSKNMLKKPKKRFSFKRFLAIVMIFTLLISYAGLVNAEKKNKNRNKEKYITEAEWAYMLADSFGDEKLLDKVTEPEKYVKGTEAVVDAVKEIGQNRLEGFLGDKAYDDDDLINLAINKGVISRTKIGKYLTKEEAHDVILNTLEMCFNPDDYPQYFDMTMSVPYTYADAWNVQKIDEDNRIITAYIDDVPEIGSVVIYNGEFGMAKPNYVTAVVEKGSGLYDISFEPVENIEDIVEDVSFSGIADFSVLSGADEVNEKRNEEERAYTGRSLVMSARAIPNESVRLLWGEHHAELNKADIEIGASLTGSMKNVDGKYSDKVKIESYAKISQDGISKEYKCSIDDKGKVSFDETTEWKNIKIKQSSEPGLNLTTEKEYFGAEIKNGIAANVKITGLSICVDFGYHGMISNRNYSRVMVSADKVEVSTAVKLSVEEKVQIAEIPILFAGGSIVLYFNVWLVAGANGEAAVWCEIDNPRVGVGVYGDKCEEKGVRNYHGHSDEDAGIGAEIELNAGFIAEAELTLFGSDVLRIADPGVDVRAYVSAKTLRPGEEYKYKSEYSGINPCIELKAQFPIVTIEASTGAGGESLVGKILSKLGVDGKWEIIKKDSSAVPCMMIYHLEQDTDGSLGVIPVELFESFTETASANDRVCTHIERKEPLGELEDNPDATEDEEDADPIHFGGIVISPEDVVLKMCDAVHDGKYKTAVNCFEPEFAGGVGFLGSLAERIVRFFTGEEYDWGELLSEMVGTTDIEVIEIYSDNLVMETNSGFLSEWVPKIPGVKNLMCTAADVHTKYRYHYKGRYKIEEETFHVRRYRFFGWRITVE